MLNPEYCLIARAYGIRYRMVEDREFLDEAVREMLASKEPYLLDVHVNGNEMVYPMIPPGKRVDEIMLNKDEWYHDAE
jgi:acetolactate synthase-1/2/3 large subunit